VNNKDKVKQIIQREIDRLFDADAPLEVDDARKLKVLLEVEASMDDDLDNQEYTEEEITAALKK
jgi:hypothetical protein